MNRYRAEQLLPKVGTEMRRTPTLIYARGVADLTREQKCVVVEVNREHLWFRVRFEDGSHECYKVPEIVTTPVGGLRRWMSKYVKNN